MHKVLYEITYRMDWKVLIPFAVLLGFLCFLIPKIRKIRREKSFKGHKADIFFCSIGVLVSLTVCSISVASQIDMYQDIVAAYEDGRYQTVEGYVEDFIPMPPEGHAHESFQINGVCFDYSENTALQGYNKTKENGGVISGNGQHLKIRYIYYKPWDTNVIVYIEELSPEN